MICARKEAKAHGTQRLVEGEYRAGERALLGHLRDQGSVSAAEIARAVEFLDAPSR